MKPDYIILPDSRPDHRSYQFSYCMARYRLTVRDRPGDTVSILFREPASPGADMRWVIPCVMDVDAAVAVLDLITATHQNGYNAGRVDAQAAMRGALGI